MQEENFRSTLALIAKMMPEEMAFEQLESALENYKSTLLVGNKETIEETKAALIFACVMYGVKFGVKDLSTEEIIKASNDLALGKSIVKRMDGDTQILKNGTE